MTQPLRLQLASTARTPNTHSTSEQEIDIEILHEFWPHMAVAESGGYAANRVTVKNTGNIVLKNVQVYVVPSDTSPQFDARITDRDGQIIDSTDAPVLNFGDLAPGISLTLPYWWTVISRFPDAQGSQTRTVTFHLYPVFTADFRQSGVSFTDDSLLDNA